MSELVTLIDLPGLQRRLDDLQSGGRLTLSVESFRRLFGQNDVGAERLSNFATGHGCSITASPSTIIFQKRG